jgi:hypothetical protein
MTCANVIAQDTLPHFRVVRKTDNRNVISWINSYPYTSQMNIQRSTDSLRNFASILTVPDPKSPQNGYVDTKAPSQKVYYRLFIVLDSGKYIFTKSKSPAPDTATDINDQVLNDNQRVVLSDSLTNHEEMRLKEKLLTSGSRGTRLFVIKRNNIYSSVSPKDFRKFRDSIVYETHDTLVFESEDTVYVKPFINREMYRASRYVYTEKYGNVMIALPDALQKKYSIRFFDDYKTPLFEIKEIKSASLIVDKTNFVHSGWFWFELYDNGELKEKHRFFIPKDF